MRGLDRLFSNSPKSGRLGRSALAISLLIAGVVTFSAGSSSAATPASRIDLRVLVLDDNSAWVGGIKNQMQLEGVPYTAVPLSGSRPTINDAFLSSGDEAFFQAVVGPDYALAWLTDAERASLRSYEATFGIREVDAYIYPAAPVGLNTPVFAGDLSGTVATVTAAGKTNGFGYLNGPVPFATGTYGYLADPMAAQLPGASFTTLVGAPMPGGATASILGVYSNAGVEQMVISAGFSQYLSEFRVLAHGIISWMTRGVHFGYNRNNFSMQVDDAFSAVALWNSDANCTPGEDCAETPTTPATSVRMTDADVTAAVQWEQDNNYQFTLAFNGAYADSAADPLTLAFMNNASAFRWLNHGYEHLYQGCEQNFDVTPWQCKVDASGTVWVQQPTIYNEIQNNIAKGLALGLPFDPKEYLSGEHSGLFLLPQQGVDNPNFGPALTQAGINYIASDASRDPYSRAVGSAITIPRHPMALYYNTSTQAAAVDEYNWLYNSRDIGGSGYCDDNPSTATCIAPLDPETGFTSYIVPTDVAYNMNFILGNDPRPFYAHVSNMSDDGLLYTMVGTILDTYRAAFTPATPVTNLTMTQAATALDRQTKWGATGVSSATGYVQNGKVTITNPSNVAAPITVPTGSTIAGATLESYGGELSGWLVPGNTTGNLPGSVLTVTGSTAFVAGTVGTINMSATGTPAASISLAGTLPAGLTFTPTPGAGVITGAPAAGSAGSYPLTITSISGTSIQVQPITLTVTEAPLAITVTGSTAFVMGQTGTVNIGATGFPTPIVTLTAGTLPAGVTFSAPTAGAAIITGTPTVPSGTFPVTITATSGAATKTQQITITVSQTPMVLTVPASAAFVIGKAGTVNITATGNPTPTVTRTGTLPAGLTFTATPGAGVITGTPAAGTAGSYPLTITAVSGLLTQTKALTLTVSQAPAFTSAASASAGAGTAFTFNVTTTGSPAATITRTGTLPTGITFVAAANGTAKLSGTPTAAMAGRTFPITFTATNAGGTVTQAFTLTVGRAPVFTGSQLALAFSSRPFSFTVQTTGTPVATLTMTGTLPKGLTFLPAANGTAKLSGTPLRGTSGIYTLTFKATNVYGTTNRTFILLVL